LGSAKKNSRIKYEYRKKSFGLFLARAVICLFIFGFLAFIYFAYDLPDISDIDEISKKQAIIIKSSDGDIIATYGDVYGDFLKYEDFPEYLIDAVIATEDRRFYSHHGFDIIGIARAMYANYKAGRWVQGGSTITQQLAKNIFLSPDRTLHRKMQELLMSLQIELRYSKKEIISTYLNRVYLGAGAYGVDAASRRYFGKGARELTLPEAAVIIGLLKAPSSYSPTKSEDMAEKRASQVILNMLDAGYLKQSDSDKYLKQLNAGLRYGHTSFNTYYFGDWLKEEIEQLFGNIKEDLVVESTLDMRMQSAAEEAIKTQLSKDGKKLKISQAAMVAMNVDGAVVAFMGGNDYTSNPFNRVSVAKRQPGSSFKPFVYLTGLEQGLRPTDVMIDEPASYGKWRPENYSGRYSGAVNMRTALAHSINTIAVQIAKEVGINNVVDTAHLLGIDSKLEQNLSLSLGTNEVSLLELTGAYGAFASGGYKVVPYGFTKVYKQHSGEVLYEKDKGKGTKVIEPEYANMMNDLLTGVVQFGTGTRANIGRPVAGKTGTSQDYRDAWFIGYTPQLICGVWVGNDNNVQMKKVTGGSTPTAMWHDFMIKAVKDMPVQAIETAWSSAGTWSITRSDSTGGWIDPDTVEDDLTKSDAEQPANHNAAEESTPVEWDIKESPPSQVEVISENPASGNSDNPPQVHQPAAPVVKPAEKVVEEAPVEKNTEKKLNVILKNIPKEIPEYLKPAENSENDYPASRKK